MTLAPRQRADENTHTDHAATENSNRITCLNTSALDGMEANRKRLDQRQMTGRQCLIEDQFFGRQHDLVGQSAILLHAERLVITARIELTFATGRAFTAIRIRQHDNPLAFDIGSADTLSGFHDLAADFMPGNARQLHQRIKPLEGVQIAAAETHVPNPTRT